MTLHAKLFTQATIPAMFPDVDVLKKIYSSPVLTKRSREQATLFLWATLGSETP